MTIAIGFSSDLWPGSYRQRTFVWPSETVSKSTFSDVQYFGMSACNDPGK